MLLGSLDCDSGSRESHSGCDGGSFPCHMLGDAFIALSDGGAEGHKVLRLRVPYSTDSPTLDVSTSELLSNGMCAIEGERGWGRVRASQSCSFQRTESVKRYSEPRLGIFAD